MLWIKSIHVISVIAWMAGLLYLPRLFVYHAEPNAPEIFKIMEKRLFRYIMKPAMHGTTISGLILAYYNEYWTEYWFLIKLLMIIGLLVCHVRMGWHVKQFANDKNQYSPKYFRIFNEIPTILMIIIVIMVIVRP